MPLLTVVIPVYNVEKYLRECLDSIVNQTYTNLEIIIVNDCSPDHSEEIVLEYQAKDPRIKYIKHEKNRAQGAARNTGITNATGEWITFVDSDDYIDLDTYEYMMDLIQKNNVDLGVFSTDWFEDGTRKNLENIYYNIPTPTKVSILDINPAPWNKIFRLSDITKYNLTFPEHLKMEDLEFLFKYLVIADPTIIGTPERSYHYRQREGSTMMQDSSIVDLGYILQNIYNFLIEKNLLDKYQDMFLLCICSNGYYLLEKVSKESGEKLLTLLQELLQNFPDAELMPYPILYTTKNLAINEHSLEFLKEFYKLHEIKNDKWYKFGQLSHKDKIKSIIKTIIKKILIKLHLFEFAKSIKNKLGAVLDN